MAPLKRGPFTFIDQVSNSDGLSSTMLGLRERCDDTFSFHSTIEIGVAVPVGERERCDDTISFHSTIEIGVAVPVEVEERT